MYFIYFIFIDRGIPLYSSSNSVMCSVEIIVLVVTVQFIYTINSNNTQAPNGFNELNIPI